MAALSTPTTATAATPAAMAPATTVRRDLPAAVATALLALAVAWAGWLTAGPMRLDVGATTDAAYLTGWYEREAGPAGSYRWASPDAILRLPSVAGPAALELVMAGRPGGAELNLAVGELPPAAVEVAPEVRRHYLLLVPPAGGGATTVALAGPRLPGVDATDTRQLTVLLERATLRGLGGQPLPPPLALLPALCALLLGAGLRLGGAGRAVAWPVAALAGVALAAGWGWGRLWVAPYLLPTALGALAVVALVAALRAAVGPSRRVGPARLVGVLAAAGALIPLYNFVQYAYQDPLHWHTLPLLMLPAGLALAAGVRPRLLGGLTLAMAVGYGAAMFAGALAIDYGKDFHAIYRGVAGFLRDGAPLYRLDQLAANPLGPLYKYPPSFALLFAPFAMPSFVPALYAWRALNVLLLLVAAWALLRAYGVPLRSWTAAGLLLLLITLRPIPDTLRYGQLDLLMLFVLAMGLWALRRGRALPWGAWIGLGAALKLYPAYMLGLALAQRRWRPVAGAAVTGGALWLAALLAFGWGPTATFLRDVLATTGGGTGWVENQTFNGLLNRLANPALIELAPARSPWVGAATYAWFLAVTALTLWLTRAGGGLRPDLGYGLWSVAMLLVLPAAWMHYATIALIPFFQSFVRARDEGGLPWPLVACLALAWSLLAHGNLWTFYDQEARGLYWGLVLSYKFYGLLLLYAAAAWPAASGRAAAIAAAER